MVPRSYEGEHGKLGTKEGIKGIWGMENSSEEEKGRNKAEITLRICEKKSQESIIILSLL